MNTETTRRQLMKNVALGAGATLWLQQVGIVIPGIEHVTAQFGMPERLRPTLTPFSLLVGPLALTVCIVIGGVAPWLRVRRLTPADAVRIG